MAKRKNRKTQPQPTQAAQPTANQETDMAKRKNRKTQPQPTQAAQPTANQETDMAKQDQNDAALDAEIKALMDAQSEDAVIVVDEGEELSDEELAELEELNAAAEKAEADLKAAKVRRAELAERALAARSERIKLLQEAIRQEREALKALGGANTVVAPKYKKRYGKAQMCGDTVANRLAGIDLDTVLKAGYEQGLLIESKHAHLNRGQQRMTLGNILRHRVTKAAKADLVFTVGKIEFRGTAS